jgi:hypothetical protein
MMGLGLGMLISAMTTKYRDLQNLVTFGIHLLDVRHPGYLPNLCHTRKIPLDHPLQPHDRRNRYIQVCIPGNRRV